MEILSLGEKIKRRRKQMNMTLKDLAKDRITPGQISLVESGRSNPSVDLLEYLADSLDTTVEYLMESEESQAEKISIYYEQIGEACILQGDYEKGQRYIENALYYSEKYNLEYRKAKILFITAKSYMIKKDFPMAQKFFLSSNVIFVKNNNYEEIIKTFINLANIALELRAYHSASSYLKQADKVYTDNNIGNDFLLGEIYYNMAKVSFTIEQVEESKKYANLAKDKFNEIQNKKQYASSLISLSDEYNRKDDSVNAIKYFLSSGPGIMGILILFSSVSFALPFSSIVGGGVMTMGEISLACNSSSMNTFRFSGLLFFFTNSIAPINMGLEMNFILLFIDICLYYFYILLLCSCLLLACCHS